MPYRDPSALREYKARWLRDKIRSREGRGTCGSCGSPMGVGAVMQGVQQCRACFLAATEAKRQRMADLRWQGKSYAEIAEEIGCSVASVANMLSRMRGAGWDLPSFI